MSKSKDSLHLHFLPKSWSFSFLFCCKRRGTRRMPPVACLTSHELHTPTHRGSCHTQPPDSGFIFHRGKPHQTTPNTPPGATPSWSKGSVELMVILLLLTLLALKYHVQFGSQHFKKLRETPEKQKQLTSRHVKELTWLSLWRRLSSSITISKQLHRRKMPDTTTLSNLTKEKNTLRLGSRGQRNSGLKEQRYSLMCNTAGN